MSYDPKQILDYWFGAEIPHEQVPEGTERWFNGGDKVDRECRERFGDWLDPARDGILDGWLETAEGALALVVLLDQFSRNVHRGTPNAFAYDERALEVARIALDRGYDRKVSPIARVFFYLPFEHSETLADQQLAVDKTREACATAKSEDVRKMCDMFADYAVRHLKVIERFGRFPHRNAILGRESTSEEIEFLKQPGSSF